MLLEVGKCYKHKLMIDVAFYILDYHGQGDEGATLSVLWLNTRGNYPMGIEDTICVTHNQLPNYHQIQWNQSVW